MTLSLTVAGPDVQHMLAPPPMSVSLSLSLSSWDAFELSQVPNFVESGLGPGALGCERGTLQRLIWLVTLPCSALVSSPLVVQTLSGFLSPHMGSLASSVTCRRRVVRIPLVMRKKSSSVLDVVRTERKAHTECSVASEGYLAPFQW